MATTSRTPIELPGEPTASNQAANKGYVDNGLADKAVLPFVGAVPDGSTSAAVVHNLGTTDVDVTVWRVGSGQRVGVPAVATDANTVTLTFGTAPTAGEYRVLVSPGAGLGGTGEGGGGGGPAAPHAATHAAGGTDPVTPTAIGAAPDSHNHDAAYSAAAHDHDGVYQAAGSYATASHDHDVDYAPIGHTHEGGGGTGEFSVKPFPPILLTGRRTVAGQFAPAIDVDCTSGTHFRIDLTADAYVIFQTPVDGQIVLLEVRAVSAHRTLYLGLDTGEPIQFPTEILPTQVRAHMVDYITFIYDARGSAQYPGGVWRVISWVKNFPTDLVPDDPTYSPII